MTPLTSGIASLALRTMLAQAGISEDMVVRLIDALQSRGIILGVLEEQTLVQQRYCCMCLHPAIPEARRQFHVHLRLKEDSPAKEPPA
jgi:hypothetical protein